MPFCQAHVKNFEDLQQSGLTILASADQYTYLKTDIDPELTEKFISNTKRMNNLKRTKLVISFNNSYAYIMYSSRWSSVDAYQKSTGRKDLCSSEDLTIISNMPRAHPHQINSIYKKALSFYQMFFYEAGFISYHENHIVPFLKQKFNIPVTKKPSNMLFLWPLRISTGYGFCCY